MLTYFLYDIIPSKNRGEAAILHGLRVWLGWVSDSCKLNVVSRDADYEEDVNSYQGIAHEIIRVPGKKTWRSVLDKVLMVFLLYYSLCVEFVFNKKPTSLKHKRAEALIKSDVVLYGHDNLVATGGFSIAVLLVATYCNLARKPLIFCFGSVGPFSGVRRRIVARACLGRFSLVVVRDKQSYEFVKTLTNNERVCLSPDPAFLMEPADLRAGEEALLSVGLKSVQGRMLGVSLCESVLKRVGDYKKQAEFLTMLWQGIGRVMRLDDTVQCVLLAHSFGPEVSQDDRWIIRRFVSCRPDWLADRVYALEGEYSAPVIKRIIGMMDLMVAMRTHALINALAMEVPAVAISVKDRYKTNGLYGDFFGLSEYIFRCDECRAIDIVNMLERAWLERAQMKTLVCAGKARAERMLMDVAESARRCLRSLVILG